VTQPFCGHCFAHPADGGRKTADVPFQQGRSRFAGVFARRRFGRRFGDFIKSVVNEKEEGHHINDPGFVQPNRTMVVYWRVAVNLT